MHEIAIASSSTNIFVKLSASSFTKLRHGRVFCGQQSASVVTTIQALKALFGLFFAGILHVHVSEHVVTEIFHHVQLLHLTKFIQLLDDFFIKLLEMIFIINRLSGLRVRWWRCVHVRNYDTRAECRFDVRSRTAIAMSTRSDFQIERAIDFILLSSKYSG